MNFFFIKNPLQSHSQKFFQKNSSAKKIIDSMKKKIAKEEEKFSVRSDSVRETQKKEEKVFSSTNTLK